MGIQQVTQETVLKHLLQQQTCPLIYVTKEMAAACYSVHSKGEALQGGDTLVRYDCQLKTASKCDILQCTTFF